MKNYLKKEIFWIEHYKSFRDYGFGYNLTTGGDGGALSEDTKRKISESHKGEKSVWWGKNHSEETKRKISIGNKGKKYTDEAKRKISESRKKYVGENHSMYGKKHSEETLSRMKENHKNGKYPYTGKNVIQLSLDGEFLNEYKTVAEAGRVVKCNRNYISQCCRGTRVEYKGFKWAFKENYNEEKESNTT